MHQIQRVIQVIHRISHENRTSGNGFADHHRNGGIQIAFACSNHPGFIVQQRQGQTGGYSQLFHQREAGYGERVGLVAVQQAFQRQIEAVGVRHILCGRFPAGSGGSQILIDKFRHDRVPGNRPVFIEQFFQTDMDALNSQAVIHEAFVDAGRHHPMLGVSDNQQTGGLDLLHHGLYTDFLLQRSLVEYFFDGYLTVTKMGPTIHHGRQCIFRHDLSDRLFRRFGKQSVSRKVPPQQ